jgi:cobalt-zinc-cadmium efflux system outer membrane protein
MKSLPGSKKAECPGFLKAAASQGRLALHFNLLILPLVLLFLTFVGCARFHSRPISASANAEALEGRSLTNAGLRMILEKNLHRNLDSWPEVEWNFDMLTFAAFYYHPSLEVARAQWAVAQGGEKTAGQRPNPTLTVTPTYNFTTLVPSPWDPVGSIDVPIETAGKRKYRRAQAANLSEAARLNIATTAWQVRSAVRSSLTDFAAAGEREAALEKQVAVQEELLRRQEQQVASGEIAASESLAVRITLQKARIDLADARRQGVEARARLSEAIGVPLRALKEVRFAAGLPRDVRRVAELTTSEVRRVALQTRPDILAALAEYAASQSALQLEIAKQYPDVHLQPGYEFDQGNSKWSLGLVVELPVLNQNQGPIAEAKARREEAAARFNALQAKILAEIDSAIEVFRISETNSNTLRKLAETQAKRRDSVAAQLKVGAVDELELLNAQIEYATAELVQLEGQIKLQQAAAAVEDSVQRPFELPDEIFHSRRTDAH